MGSLHECEHKQMGQRMWPWMREGVRLGQGAHARCKRYWKGAWAWASSLRGSSISCAEVCFVSSLFSLHFIFANIIFRYYGWCPLSHFNSAYFNHHPPTFQPNLTPLIVCLPMLCDIVWLIFFSRLWCIYCASLHTSTVPTPMIESWGKFGAEPEDHKPDPTYLNGQGPSYPLLNII